MFRWQILGCPKCCYDCKRVECTTCIKTEADGTQKNIRGWFAELCTMLSNGTTAYEIEHVRVYQDPDAINVGCDPPAYPTARWIAAHEETYRTPAMAAPLAAVTPGGGACGADAECGGGLPLAECGADNTCTCLSANRTGPLCASQAAGAARACRQLEDIALAAARGAASAAWDEGNGPLQCAPPKAYSSAQLLALAAAACETGSGGSSVWWSWAEASQGTGQLASACAAIDVLAAAEFAACSPHARATLVVHALLADGGGVACCDTIHEEGPPTYAVRLLCRRGPRLLWAALVPSLLLGAAVVIFLRGACRPRGGANGSRRTMWSTRDQQLAAAVQDTLSNYAY